MIARTPLCERHTVWSSAEICVTEDVETVALPSVRCVTAEANCFVVKTAKVS
jgi:hypothetical protein